MRLQEFGADFVANFGDVSLWLEFCDFEDEFARERVAVGMETGGRKREERVAGFYTLSGEQFFSLDGADDEACKIVFAGGIESGHFRGFSTDEGAARFAASAAHAINELFDDMRVHFSERQVIEKEERLGALYENVVHAVIDEIAADGGMNVHGHGDF